VTEKVEPAGRLCSNAGVKKDGGHPSSVKRALAGRAPLLVCLSLVALVAVIYLPTAGHDFLSYDDNLYVRGNPSVRGGLTASGAWWALTSVGYAGNWHPLTWLSHQLDVTLFGVRPGPMHLVNAGLHATAAAALFLVLRGMTGAFWRSAIVAALFAVHPLRVESVAWIAERKDVLSGLLFVLTLGAWLGYARRPGPGRYGLALGLFALGLTAKPMLVTVPLVLLLVDYWPLGRVDAPWGAAPERAEAAVPRFTPGLLLLEKAPFLVLAAASSWVTVVAQSRGGALSTGDMLPVGSRLANAVRSLAAYLGLTVWPTDLAVLYPITLRGVPAGEASAALLLVGAITAAALWQARRRAWLTVGWLWYVGMLIPVIGIVQVGAQSMADRYTYLPHIGLLTLVVWGGAELAGRLRIPPRSVVAAAGVAALVLASVAVHQVGYWKDSLTLFRRAVAVTRDNYLAEYNLGVELADMGNLAEAEAHLRASLAIMPGYPRTLNNLGNIRYAQGRLDEAEAFYRLAVKADPKDHMSAFNLGLVMRARGRFEEAERILRDVLGMKPDFVEARNALGGVMAATGRSDEAERLFRRAMEIAPRDHNAPYNLGVVLAGRGMLDEAESLYRRAIALKPDFANARTNLGSILSQRGRNDEALSQLMEAARLAPGDAIIHYNIGTILASRGDREGAAARFREALRLKPDFAPAAAELDRTLRSP
jgi:Flp pilus assembly protein TadD